ncbi:MAG TPA: hemolysin family protein [Polyangiaceae bacterium]|nr:hemolysin family protein [Polyangiaceae bacterium]
MPACFAATFAAASWAISSLSGARRAALRDALDGGARRALHRYLESGTTIEARWLVIRALGISLTAVLMARQLPWTNGWTPAVAALIAVLTYALPSEVLRALAAREPERSAPRLLQLLRPVELLAAPIADPVLWLSRFVSDWFAAEPKPATAATPAVTETEVELIVNEGELNGSLDHDQSEMIRNVLEFGDVTAGQVMVPRTQVSAFALDTPVEDMLAKVVETEHSRYPVYRESVDNIIGVLHVKDLMRAAAHNELSQLRLEQVLHKAAFVPESQPAASVLKEMRAGGHHLAIVIDEFGGFSGIVTLEDLLEQIVGDIKDEHDVEEPPIVDLGDGRLMADASVSISDLSRYLGAELPEDGDYNSLGGFVVAQLGKVPEIGTKLVALGLEFTVREGDERHVSKIEIARVMPPESIAPRSSSRMTAA